MNRSQKLAIRPHDFRQLNTLALACRGLESLLITQDAEMHGTLNPMQLAALLSVMAEGIEQATEECSTSLIKHQWHRKPHGRAGRR